MKVDTVNYNELTLNDNVETSQVIRDRVVAARAFQMERSGTINSQMTPEDTKRHCSLNNLENELLAHAMEKQQLSARSYDRILKVARTIADLDCALNISLIHLSEAITYRCFDSEYYSL